MLSGKVKCKITLFLYEVCLCALSKKDGGIRPIAVGCIFRRLISRLGCYHRTSGKCYKFILNKIASNIWVRKPTDFFPIVVSSMWDSWGFT